MTLSYLQSNTISNMAPAPLARPQSNGKSENAVKTVERIIHKALESGTDAYLGFLPPPAQGLFGRRTKTRLSSSSRLLKPRDADHTAQLLQDRKDKQTKKAKPLRKGDTVLIKPLPHSNRWTNSTVDGKVGTGSYQVSSGDSRVYRRNRRRLRITAETPKSTDPMPTMPFPSVTEEPQPETCGTETPRDTQPSSDSGD